LSPKIIKAKSRSAGEAPLVRRLNNGVTASSTIMKFVSCPGPSRRHGRECAEV